MKSTFATTAQAQSAQALGTAKSGFVSQAGSRLSTAMEYLRGRLAEACQAFNERLEIERKLTEASKKAAERKVADLKESRTGAVLVSPQKAVSVPLFVGTNFFRMGPSGDLIRCEPDPFNQGGGELLQVRVMDGHIEIASGNEAPSSFLTNDNVTFGNAAFVVKVLPKNYRPVTVVKENV